MVCPRLLFSGGDMKKPDFSHIETDYEKFVKARNYIEKISKHLNDAVLLIKKYEDNEKDYEKRIAGLEEELAKYKGLYETN